jgi:hypothetical protein
MGNNTVTTTSTTDQKSVEQVDKPTNPMEKSQITGSPFSPTAIQSVILGGAVSLGDGNGIGIAIIEQLTGSPAPQLQQPNVVLVPIYQAERNQQFNSQLAPAPPPIQQPPAQNPYQPFATIPSANQQSYQSFTQVPQNTPAQISSTPAQTSQTTRQTVQESNRDSSLSQVAIPSSLLPNQIQSALSNLFQSSQRGSEPIPVQLLKLNQSSSDTIVIKTNETRATQSLNADSSSAGVKSSDNESVKKDPALVARAESSPTSTPRAIIRPEDITIIDRPVGQTGDNSSNQVTLKNQNSDPRITVAPDITRGLDPIPRADLPQVELARSLPISPATQPNTNIQSEVNIQQNIAAKPEAQPLLPVPPATPQQRQEQQRDSVQEESRRSIERSRDIQQIIATERDLSAVTTRIISDIRVTPPNTRPELINVTIERTRESILDKLSSIQERVEPSIREPRRPIEQQRDANYHVQGREILARPVELSSAERREPIAARLADRASGNRRIGHPQQEQSRESGTSSAADKARVRVNDSSSQPSSKNDITAKSLPAKHLTVGDDRLPHLLDFLKRFSQRSVNFKLLGKIDNSLEKACLTVVTGAALGVIGIGLTYKAINLALLHTLGFLRDEHEADIEKEAVSEEQELMKQLEEFTTTEINSVGEQGFVVDLAGIVLSAKLGTPIANATVKCAEFGSRETDTEGRFIFTNIPLGTPYTITVSSDDLALKPLIVSGVCGELEFLRIRVEEVEL